MIATGVITAATLLIKGKAYKFANISFDKGIAKFKNGNNFAGVIEDKLSNGKLVKLTYKDGLIQEAIQNGCKKQYIYKHGATKPSKVICVTTDEIKDASYEYFENGRLKEVVATSGRFKSFYEDGKLFQDGYRHGDIKTYNKAGQKINEIQGETVETSWDANGIILETDGFYKSIQRSYDNGLVNCQYFGRNVMGWYDNGQIQCQGGNYLGQTFIGRTWHDNGQIEELILPDGSKTKWYKNGQKEYEITSEGLYKQWSESGELLKSYKTSL